MSSRKDSQQLFYPGSHLHDDKDFEMILPKYQTIIIHLLYCYFFVLEVFFQIP